jgi:hypothetical protein
MMPTTIVQRTILGLGQSGWWPVSSILHILLVSEGWAASVPMD